MSTALHYGPTFIPVSSSHGSITYGDHYSPSDFAASSMDMLAHGGPYPAGQLPHDGSPGMTSPVGHAGLSSGRHHPYGGTTLPSNEASPPAASPTHRQGPGSGGSGPVRRRISRACDQCNQLRTKCDGQNPCAHCVEFGLTCEYMRERKKRGKASRKDIQLQQQQQQQQQQQAAMSASPTSPHSSNVPASRTGGHCAATAVATASMAKRGLSNVPRTRDSYGSLSPTTSNGYVDDSSSEASLGQISQRSYHPHHHHVSTAGHPADMTIDQYLPPMSDVAGFPLHSVGVETMYDCDAHTSPTSSVMSDRLLESDMDATAAASGMNRPPTGPLDGYRPYGVDGAYHSLHQPVHTSSPYALNMMATGGAHPQADAGDWVPLQHHRRGDLMSLYGWQTEGPGLAL